MPLSYEARKKIADLFLDSVYRTIERVGDSLSKDLDSKPFHEALIPLDVRVHSKFERSFSTSFGQKAVETIARVVVEDSGGKAEGQHTEKMHIDRGRLSAIELYRENARSNKLKLNWKETLYWIGKNTKLEGELMEVSVKTDLYYSRVGAEAFFSLKTVKPNIDQTMEAKIDLLKLHYGRNVPSDTLGFGLWYNPYGEGHYYNYSPPKSVFSMNEDSVVYIGSQFWNTLGGPETYRELIQIASEVGTNTVRMIDEAKVEWI